jgi:hypothetical protein
LQDWWEIYAQLPTAAKTCAFNQETIMSTAQIEKFYAIASKDQTLFDSMMKGTKGPDDFVRNAVAAAKQRGYEFSYEEADAWIKQQQKIKASGELSDSQLETVAGGKGTSESVSYGQTANQAASQIGNPNVSITNQSAAAFEWLGTKTIQFFTSW